VHVSHTIALPERLPAELEGTAFRLVQEALTNVAKHAEADAVELRIGVTDGVVEIVVADDGRGMDLDAPTAGFGLVGMRERAELVGGVLDIASAPGSGTTLRARIPVGGYESWDSRLTRPLSSA
jgi:two-component system sensor histidine kinase UhpB